MKKNALLFLIFMGAAALAAGIFSHKPEQPAPVPAEPQPVEIARSLYYNGDSLLYYAKLAYIDDDPHGLYVTAVASYISGFDPDFPDSICTVPRDEAEIMLLHSAELGYPEALQLIRCLDYHGCWHHSLPEWNNK